MVSDHAESKLTVLAARFGPDSTRGGDTWAPDAQALIFETRWNFSGNPRKFKWLRHGFHHGCVLFVQHLFENGSNRAFPRRSVVACAELFMDVDRATEGGIPRSSR
jgi:hypothetical protein